MTLHNKYYLLRHGEALSNLDNTVSSWPETFENPLTENGRKMIQDAAHILEDKNIELIFASDLLRTQQTAAIVAEHLKVEVKFDKSSTTFTKKSFFLKGGFFGKNNVDYKKVSSVKVVLDKRLREIDFGIFNGKKDPDVDAYFNYELERISKKIPGGESYDDVASRMMNFLQDVDVARHNKNILIVSHECPLWILWARVQGIALSEVLIRGEVRELNPKL